MGGHRRCPFSRLHLSSLAIKEADLLKKKKNVVKITHLPQNLLITDSFSSFPFQMEEENVRSGSPFANQRRGGEGGGSLETSSFTGACCCAQSAVSIISSMSSPALKKPSAAAPFSSAGLGDMT